MSHRFGRPSQGRGRKIGPADIRRANRPDCMPGRDKSGGSGELKRQLAASGHAEGRAVAACRVGTIAIVAARPRHPGDGIRRRRRGAAVGHHVCRHHHIEAGHRRRDTRQQHGKGQQRREPVTAAGDTPVSRAAEASFHAIRLARTSLRRATQKCHRIRAPRPRFRRTLPRLTRPRKLDRLKLENSSLQSLAGGSGSPLTSLRLGKTRTQQKSPAL